MDKSSRKRLIIIITVVAVVVIVPWGLYFSTSNQLRRLQSIDDHTRLKAAKALLAKADKGGMDKNSADKALEIVADHLGAKMRAEMSKAHHIPTLWIQEFDLGFTIAKGPMASQHAKARFFHALTSPLAEYVPGQLRRIDIHGGGRLLPGFIWRQEVVITSVDGSDRADKVRDEYRSATEDAGWNWGIRVNVDSQPEPAHSITAKLISSWYIVPLDIAAELPESGKKPEHIEQLEKVLKMDSTQHLCTYSRSVTLSKETEWKGWFPDYPESQYRLSVEGRIRFDACPIGDYTSGRPRISFNNTDSGRKGVKPRIDYNDGAFKVYGLGAANYVMFVLIDANTSNPGGYPGYPGDFSSSPLRVSVPDSGAAEMKVDMMRVIHLVSPQDNQENMPLWGEPVDRKITFKNPVTFAWDSMGDGVQYNYKICRTQAKPFRYLQTVAEKPPFGATSFSVTLPASRPNEYYRFILRATKGQRQVGQLITHGKRGHGWDFRFRVD